MTVIIGGVAFSNITEKNVRNVPAPSINAASSISAGRPLKNCLKINIYSPERSPLTPNVIKNMGVLVLSNPISLICIYIGTIMVCAGTTIVTITKLNKRFLNGKLNLANP